MKISNKQYAKLMYELVADAAESTHEHMLLRIAHMIRENGDQRRIDAITHEFAKLFDQRQGIVHATVITVWPLGEHQRNEVCALIAQRTGTDREKVMLATKTDPTIKGGMIIRIGNEIWDASIKRKIEHLATQLTH